MQVAEKRTVNLSLQFGAGLRESIQL